MAGIGFALNRLTKRHGINGFVQAFTYGTIASSGPWLITVLCLAAITIVATPISGIADVTEFRIQVMYNFAFSLVLTGGIVRLLTRLLADKIYARTLESVPDMVVGAIVVSAVIQLPIVGYVYFVALDITPLNALFSTINYFLISSIWVLSIFLSALRAYRLISVVFAGGLGVGFVSTVIGLKWAGLAGMVMGFNVGLALVVFILGARILAEYPGRIRRPFAFLSAIVPYRVIFVSGLVYSVAIWIDKWIMWFAPGRAQVPSGLIYYSHYDTAMFLSYLTTVPAMAIFLINVETQFYRNYYRFYKDIESQATLSQIRVNHRTMYNDLVKSFRNVFFVQALISLLFILMAPTVLQWLGINIVVLGMFRLGVLGAFFHTMMLLVTIILSYFDLRIKVLGVFLIFLASNGLLTTWSMLQGFDHYGLGYCIASIITLLIAALILIRDIRDIPYLTFLRSPSALTGSL